MKILLAHLGNRNLLFEGKTFYSLPREQQEGGFRAFSQRLLREYPTLADKIGLNILPPLLEAHSADISQIILFSSDHPPGYRNDQDTCYAGEVLARKLKELYPLLPVHNEIIRQPVTDPNKLLQAYRKALNEIQDTYPDAQLMVCDAGGTPQQKSALKIMLEFLYDPEDIEVYYVAQGQNYESVLELAEPVEYRRIIDAEQLFGLIEHGYYQGAIELYGRRHRAARFKPLWPLLHFGQFRKQRLTAEARRYAEASQYPADLYAQLPFLRNFQSGEPLGSNWAWAGELMPQEVYFDLCELLSLVQFQLSLRDYTQVVMQLSRFVENYIRALLTHQFACPFDKSNGEGIRKMMQIAGKMPHVSRHFGKRPLKAVLATEILVCQELPNLPHQRLIKHIQMLNSQLHPLFRGKRRQQGGIVALNEVRNRVAHQGQGVSEATFNAIPGLVQFVLLASEILGLPESNVYLEMNAGMMELLTN